MHVGGLRWFCHAVVYASAASTSASIDVPCSSQASLPGAWCVHPVRFGSVLSVLEHGGRLRWSLLPAAALWRTPPQPQAARGCSRAVHKLQEALAALRRAGSDPGPVRVGTAIDLGARPSLSRAVLFSPCAVHNGRRRWARCGTWLFGGVLSGLALPVHPPNPYNLRPN